MERPSSPRTRRRWVVGIVLLLVTVLVLELTSVDVLLGLRRSWEVVDSAQPWLLALALALEAGSFACFSGLTRTLLPTSRPGYPTVLAIDLTGNGSSRVLPGGGASAAVLRYRLLGSLGVGSGAAASAATAETAITTMWLVAGLGLGLVLAVPHPGTQPLLKTACVVAVVALTAIGGVVAVLTARPDAVVSVTHRVAAHVPLLRPQVLEGWVRGLIALVQTLTGGGARSRQALLWGLGNWALDVAALWTCLWAFGVAANPGGLVTTHAVVSLIAMLPLTPGGIGLVEGVAVPMLVSFGVPGGAALLGVLAWRLLSFWLPIPVGLGSYSWLRLVGARSSATPAAGHRGTRPR